jgi:hypothetical protein
VTEGGIGQVLDATRPDEEAPSIEEQERDWSVAVHRAVTLAKQAGKTPAGLARTLEGAAEATGKVGVLTSSECELRVHQSAGQPAWTCP